MLFRSGSVFVIHSEQGFDRGKLVHLFLGERVSEGYGEIQIDEIPQQAEYGVYDITKCTAYEKQQDMLSEKIKTNLIEQLRERRKETIRTSYSRNCSNNSIKRGYIWNCCF